MAAHRPLILLAVLPLLAGPARSAPVLQGAMEEFEELDPWTEEDPEALAALGYTWFGPFAWIGADRTPDVQQKLGGTPMIFVETEHFRIGSSLTTYPLPGDKEERERIEEELKRLRKKWRRFDPRVKELDPWLRLHLYAQRAEDLWDAFHADFGLERADYEDMGPYLGHPNKHLLLLCERSSEFQRFLGVYLEAQGSHTYRWGWHDDCTLYVAEWEAMVKGWEDLIGAEIPFDSMLHCRVATGLALNCLDALRQNQFSMPSWLGYGLAHTWSRRIDPRFVYQTGRDRGRALDGDDHEWDPRLANLVRNDFHASAEEMFGWHRYSDLDERDHMVAWSRLEYLLEEAQGDPAAFVLALAVPLAATDGDQRRAALVERQEAALAAAFDLTGEELVAKWARWARRRHR